MMLQVTLVISIHVFYYECSRNTHSSRLHDNRSVRSIAFRPLQLFLPRWILSRILQDEGGSVRVCRTWRFSISPEPEVHTFIHSSAHSFARDFSRTRKLFRSTFLSARTYAASIPSSSEAHSTATPVTCNREFSRYVFHRGLHGNQSMKRN